MPPRILRNLKIDDVSSVDVGAGRGVRVVLAKRDTGGTPGIDAKGASAIIERAVREVSKRRKTVIEPPKNVTKNDVLEAVEKAVQVSIEKGAVDFSSAYEAGEAAEAAGDLMHEVYEAVRALDCSIASILGDDEVTDKRAAIETSYDQFEAYLETLCPPVGDEDDDKTEKKDMTTPALSPAVEKIIADAVAKAVGAKQGEIEALSSQVAYLKMSKEHQSYHDSLGSDVDKKKFTSMSEQERDAEMNKTKKRWEEDPIYKSLQAENLALKKRLDDMDAARDLDVAKADAKAMGLTQKDAGEVLMKSRRGDREAHKILEGYMLNLAKRQQALEETSVVFKEFGTARGDTGEAGSSAHDEFMAKAAELRKADPKLTEAQAFDKVYNDPANRELRKRDSEERMRKIHRVA